MFNKLAKSVLFANNISKAGYWAAFLEPGTPYKKRTRVKEKAEKQ